MSDALPSTRHNILAAGATVLGLLLLVGFAWRVSYFVRLIQVGGIDQTDLSFLSNYSPSFKTDANQPLPEGEFQLATTDDPSLGSPEAPVTIVEFADFGCPYSRESSFVLRSLARTYGDRIHYVYRDFPIDELHPEARLAAEAAECADEQGKFWEYHDKLYINQTDLSKERLVQFAEEINANVPAFTFCVESRRYQQEVEEDFATGAAAGVAGTPTFFVNGNRIPGAIPEDVLDTLIKRAIGP